MILSIVIPLYNTEKYIEECLLSIVDNNVDASLYEVIVVNDGSTDNSKAVVERLCEEYGNIKLINQENQGVSTTRMNGASSASGDFLWFVDSDDYLLPNALETAFTELEKDASINMIAAPLFVFFETSGKGYCEYQEPGCISGKECLSKVPPLISPCHFIFRRALLENQWLFFPKGIRFEDEYFSRVLQYLAGTISVLREPLYAYRQHASSFMNSAPVSASADMVASYRYLKDFAEKGAAPSDKGWFSANILSLILDTHTRHQQDFHTSEFRAFRKKNGEYIKKEFRHNFRHLSQKDRILGVLLLWYPALYKTVIKWYHAHKQARKNPA